MGCEAPFSVAAGPLVAFVPASTTDLDALGSRIGAFRHRWKMPRHTGSHKATLVHCPCAPHHRKVAPWSVSRPHPP